jgi:hypothetical protein
VNQELMRALATEAAAEGREAAARTAADAAAAEARGDAPQAEFLRERAARLERGAQRLLDHVA